MSDLTSLRLAVALVHPVPDARIRLECAGGPLDVGRHPSADLDPCELRRLLLGRCPHLRDVRHVAVGGALAGIGAGIYRRLDPVEGEQRWLATFLAPGVVRDLIVACPLDDVGDAFAATVLPDEALGATAVWLGATRPSRTSLDEVALWCAAVCLTEELICSARSVAA